MNWDYEHSNRTLPLVGVNILKRRGKEGDRIGTGVEHFSQFPNEITSDELHSKKVF